MPALDAIPLPLGYIPFPFQNIHIRRQPLPSQRFVPNDSTLDVTELPEEQQQPVEQLQELGRTTLTSTTAPPSSSRPMIRITIRPRMPLPTPDPAEPAEPGQPFSAPDPTFDFLNPLQHQPHFGVVDGMPPAIAPAAHYPSYPSYPSYPAPPPPPPAYTKASGYVSNCAGPPGPPGE